MREEGRRPPRPGLPRRLPLLQDRGGGLIDAYASNPWYAEHIAPIWRALGDEAGRFHITRPDAMAAAGDLRGLTDLPIDRIDRPILTVGYADMATARKAGRTSLALGQHGCGQSYLGAGGVRSPGYPGGTHQDEVSLFLVPNATAARVTREAYPAARTEIVGCPKLDDLPARRPDGTGPVVAIAVHWDARVSPESMTAWPAFRTSLLRLGETRRVLGHAHPRALRRLATYYRSAGIEIVTSFREVLERADVLICDNSSAMFEFASTGRPVVVLNAPQYRRAVDHGLRFWEAAGVGVNVEAPRELDAALERALELRPDDVAAREAALALVYQPRSGGARLAAGVLSDWASGPLSRSD